VRADTLIPFPYTSPQLSRNDRETNNVDNETARLDDTKSHPYAPVPLS